MSREEIKKICEKYSIKNYTINSDGSIDVNSDVNLGSYGFTKLPLKFKNVSGIFYCDNNNLTSLEGAPQSVGGIFYCAKNNLTSLEGAPQSVGGSFYCDNNNLTSLEGAPQSVGGGFYCDNNNLTSLEGAPQSVGGGFYCDNNNLTILEGAPQSVGGGFYCDNYLFEDMVDWTKPFLTRRKSWRNKIIGNYKSFLTEKKFIEYFKAIERDNKLKELGI
jgi:hypothetical protein